MNKLFTAVLLIAALTQPAQAEHDSVKGQLLSDMCDESKFNECEIYIMGAWGVLKELNKVCPPKDILHYRIVDPVIEYMGNHPDSLSDEAGEFIVKVLVGEFPCK